MNEVTYLQWSWPTWYVKANLRLSMQVDRTHIPWQNDKVQHRKLR